MESGRRRNHDEMEPVMPPGWANFWCVVCGDGFVSERLYRNHIRDQRHPICSGCGELFASNHHLKQHTRGCPYNHRVQTCMVCWRQYENEVVFQNHKCKLRLDFKKKITSAWDPQLVDAIKGEKNCPVCNKQVSFFDHVCEGPFRFRSLMELRRICNHWARKGKIKSPKDRDLADRTEETLSLSYQEQLESEQAEIWRALEDSLVIERATFSAEYRRGMYEKVPKDFSYRRFQRKRRSKEPRREDDEEEEEVEEEEEEAEERKTESDAEADSRASSSSDDDSDDEGPGGHDEPASHRRAKKLALRLIPILVEQWISTSFPTLTPDVAPHP